MMVGRITNYHGACRVRRGQEKGRFEFGGSTILLLFQKGAVRMEDRLIRNTPVSYTHLDVYKRQGMGMWIINRIVAEYNGYIDLSENKNSEKGFYITIRLNEK